MGHGAQGPQGILSSGLPWWVAPAQAGISPTSLFCWPRPQAQNLRGYSLPARQPCGGRMT